jgi:hypothetical protein
VALQEEQLTLSWVEERKEEREQGKRKGSCVPVGKTVRLGPWRAARLVWSREAVAAGQR